MTATTLPIIDIGPYLDPAASAEQRQAVSRALDKACREHGFFYLVNHGVPQDLCDRVRAQGHQFFQLPEEEKRKHKVAGNFRGYKHFKDIIIRGRASLNEAIAFYPPVNCYSDGIAQGVDPTSPSATLPTMPDALGSQNSWPSDEFRAATEEYRDLVLKLGDRVLSAIAAGLGIGDSFRDWLLDPTWSIRFNGYPSLTGTDTEKAGDVSLGAHVDYACITILNQDPESASLQVMSKSGEWHKVQPLPGAFVVNTGKMLSLWTCNQYPARLHRVVHRDEKPRVSVATFIDPRFNAVIGPLPELAVPGEEPIKYTPKTFGSHLVDQLRIYSAMQQKQVS
ncbi:hypothetical protein THASP1DRAFT_27379 [Thamnocephalis sphaerospora]|uniref:Fe2OG dioxygenase domain-containing protein n=1 Tax=Thamnocephalis sphaerospora TaxID=78915 RepID=A0A4P9XZE0_9FUNG|nr:hypothetical protein THASP1DRAFT_27379 [Thamnocephalis sphaerospora]|eukprot:RKP10840.1 hypothetical protein THASP1DRAFT_27379 [Thamnocephalis sphaerospora]